MKPGERPAQAPRSYVTMGAGQDVFAVAVENVREILDFQPPTALPNAPPFLAGMIDVRGTTIPVVDLRIRLGLPAAATTLQTRILVTEVAGTKRPVLVGLLTDRVFEVAEIEPAAVEPAPEIGIRWTFDGIAGVGRLRGGFVMILDLDTLLGTNGATRPESAP